MEFSRKAVIRRDGSEDNFPRPFGYKIAWIAVTSDDGFAVAESLGLEQIQPCSWKDGLLRAYDLEGVFVSPPIDGFIVAPGRHPEVGDKDFAPHVTALCQRFGEAFYFGTHRIVDYHAWARAKTGKITRAFAYLGERQEVLLDIGTRSEDEVAICAGTALRDGAPTEETVLEIASKWALDPRKLDQRKDADGPGWFGVR